MVPTRGQGGTRELLAVVRPPWADRPPDLVAALHAAADRAGAPRLPRRPDDRCRTAAHRRSAGGRLRAAVHPRRPARRAGVDIVERDPAARPWPARVAAAARLRPRLRAARAPGAHRLRVRSPRPQPLRAPDQAGPGARRGAVVPAADLDLTGHHRIGMRRVTRTGQRPRAA